MTISVTDHLRGGKFDFFDSSANLMVDDAIVIPAPNGYWVRDVSQTEKTFVTWFGAKGDGKNDDSKAVQRADDYVKTKGGGTVWFPQNADTSKYYRFTVPVYRSSGVHWEGVKDKSIIYNDTLVFYGFNTQGCMFMGNYQPTSFDDAKFYDMKMLDTTNKIVLTGSYVDSITRFKSGDIVIIKGLTSWYNSKGYEKPFVVRINEVDTVLYESKTLVLKYQLDTILTAGKISITGHFNEGSDKAKDNFKHPSYFVKDCSTKNLVFKSNGQWMLGVSALNCTFENLKVVGAELFSGNAMAFCSLKNIYGNWWKQVHEFAIGCHNTTVEGTVANYINNPYLAEGNSNQPCIKFGENVYAVTLKNIYVNAGNYNGRGIWFGAARNCTVDNITMIGRKMTKDLIEFSNTENDASEASYIIDNKIINSNFYANNVDTIGYYVLMYKPIVAGARLENNSVINTNFYGKASPVHSIKLDGINPVISNVNAETGALMRGDSLRNGVVEGGTFVNPFTVTGTDMGITFKNVSDKTGNIRTDVTGIRLRGNPADTLDGQLSYDSTGDKLNFRHKNITTDLLASIYNAIPLIVVLPADSATTLTTPKPTGLRVPVEANKKYSIIVNGRSSCSGTGGIYYGITIPSGTAYAGQFNGSNTGASANSAVVKLNAGGNLTSAALNKFDGAGTFTLLASVSIGDTAGYLDFIYASATAGETSTLKENSTLIIQQLR